MNPRMPESESGALPLGDAPVLVEGAGFEPAKALPTDLQSAPFGHLGIPPVLWCPGAESNHRHEDFQSSALPTELPGRLATRKGLEPSTSSVTGWRSNHLNYRAIPGDLAWWAFRDSNPGPTGYEPVALPTELKAQKLATTNINIQ